MIWVLIEDKERQRMKLMVQKYKNEGAGCFVDLRSMYSAKPAAENVETHVF
jgi:hypothetical protein